MSVEEYVAGGCRGGDEGRWPEAAYAAQAILARTFAMRYMEEKGTREIPPSTRRPRLTPPENVTGSSAGPCAAHPGESGDVRR